jgi:hypothetical protein
MYKVKVKKGKTLYFADWESVCQYCMLAGISLKYIKVVTV